MLKLGFSCVWDRPPQGTWSYTPWHLRAALRETCEVTDIDLTFPKALGQALRLCYARPGNGRLNSNWGNALPTKYISGRRLARAARAADVDAVIEIGDIGTTELPFFVYQDLTLDLIIEAADNAALRYQFTAMSQSRLKALRDRQYSIFERATGIIAMSKWCGESLTRLSGVPKDRVHVVYPGITATGQPSEEALRRRQVGPRRRLLFVGSNFVRKGGIETLAAFELLRRDFDADMNLTIAGPSSWPMNSAVPEGVSFVGRVPPKKVAALYDEHDLFVMPSRFDAFGIVFIEALSYGLPCIARDAFAMPELVQPGVNGELVKSESPTELAAAIASVLSNDAIFAETERRRAASSNFFTWRRAAEQTVAAIETHDVGRR